MRGLSVIGVDRRSSATDQIWIYEGGIWISSVFHRRGTFRILPDECVCAVAHGLGRWMGFLKTESERDTRGAAVVERRGAGPKAQRRR